MKAKPTSRIPILLSAFICPGAGQFIQRRWIAGTVFAAGFLWGFCWVMVLAAGNIIDYYRLGFEFGTYEPDPTSPLAFVAPLAIAMVFYLVNLFDVLVAQQRIAHELQEEEFRSEHLQDKDKAG